LAAFVGCDLFLFIQNSIPTFSKNNQCVYKYIKKPEGFILNNGCIDLWHFMHLFFWILIGLLIPNMYIQALIFSVLFELWEVVDCGCGRIEDVFINMAGYTIGSLLSKAR
jgi:hypothetical protein